MSSGAVPDFLLEVGVEEIPARMVEGALEALERLGRWHLAEARLRHGRVEVFATPRRLALRVADIAARTDEAVERLKGPPDRVAFADGRPTAAAEGFARRAGVGVGDLARADGYVWAERRTPGRPAAEVLVEIVPRIVAGIPWPKSMRWKSSSTPPARFVRPVRWLVCLLGARVLPVEVAGVRAGAVTFGRRFTGRRATFLTGPRVPIHAPRRYLDLLERAGVLADRDRRIGRVARLLADAAKKEGASLDFAVPTLEAIETLADLVEEPSVVAAEFDERHLSLPREIVRVCLWHHQKYVGLADAHGRPTNRFLVVRNAAPKDPGAENVAAGNRRVVEARLADAAHFFREDRRRPLEAHRERLRGVVFHERAGTLFERTERIGRLAARIAVEVGIARKSGEAARAERAGRLSKADLVTQTVFEFPELQGTVGRILARLEGEFDEVAEAIEDHYKPTGARGDLPRAGSIAGAVALADKIDLLVALFAAGERPDAAGDPFGLRRAAIGVLRILLRDHPDAPHPPEGPAGRWHLPLRATIAFALEGLAAQGRPAAAGVADDVVAFVRGRLATLLAERGIRRDIVEAALAAGDDDPAEAAGRAEAIEAWRSRPDFEAITTSFKRVANILDDGAAAGRVDPALFEHEAERALHAEAGRLEARARVHRKKNDVPALLEDLAAIRPAVDRFFDDVLVNCDDAARRANRKALLARLADLFRTVVDFSKVHVART